MAQNISVAGRAARTSKKQPCFTSLAAFSILANAGRIPSPERSCCRVTRGKRDERMQNESSAPDLFSAPSGPSCRQIMLEEVPISACFLESRKNMNDSLKKRLESVYPHGNDWDLDENQLVSDTWVRFGHAFRAICEIRPVRVAQGWNGKILAEVVVTDADAPSFGEWLSMNNPAKLRWIAERQSPYVAYWVRVSRVADYFVSHFNHWKPRGDTGYLDADCSEQPSEVWRQHENVVLRVLHEYGFTLADRKLLNEPVPSVLTWGGSAIPENDPRWEDDDFEPPPVTAVVYDCLFGDE
ncbi:MAG: hypothetical protein LBB76_08305 [Azoarcus sp.]|jgi:hypothetical protein|nr:hypothetical protein [Azoarcus sp.]